MIADLTNARLLIPAIQPEALPITPVKPSPCTLACPAGINVKAYVSLIAEGRFAEALETIRKRCPLPGICGRICHHPCEKACKRDRYDDPVAIRALKRFVADHERDYPEPVVPRITHSERIAIIGSGPAGLTAAYDLRLAGYMATIFEGESEAGGMLRYGIADYRLPPEVLDTEIDVIRRAGVRIVCGTAIGRDLTFNELRNDGYAATLIAVGAQRGRRLGLKDEEKTPEVEDALSFLRRVKSGDRSPLAGRVVVIGGGSTAVEAARTALRLGAKSVEVLYRRYREELLADDEEVHAAEQEGVHFRFLIAPHRLVKKRGRLIALECVKIGLGEPDASGRRRPIEIPGSEFPIDVDHVLAAIGQFADFEFLPRSLAPKDGRMGIDDATSMTSMPGVFAAGDVVTGPATVIDAIAAGHRAAGSIRMFLETGTASVPEQQPERRAAVEYEFPDPEPLHMDRIHLDLIAPEGIDLFTEVERAFTADEAIAEARRCLRCGPCGECRVCATTCSRRHIMIRSDEGESFLIRTPGAVALNLASDHAAPALLHPRGAESQSVEVLPVRSRIEADRCRTCGRCVDVCPFHALSMNDESSVKLNAALCRGCGLCSAVCPTSAAMQSALSPEWWSDRLDSALATRTGGQSLIVLACQRRAGSLEKAFDEHGVRVEVIRFRCVGQMEAGMILELSRQPFTRVLVAGCVTDRCRFTNGAKRAAEQLERAQRMLRSAGADASRIAADWSSNRAGDRLEPAVARLTGGH